MKKLALFLSLAVCSLGFTSCCAMFGASSRGSSHLESRQVKTCGYDIVTREVVTPGNAKSGKGGMTQTIQEKVPRYKTVTKRVCDSCGPCVRFYCPRKDNCGTTSASTLVISSAQGSVGSPNIGLIPTMKTIAP